MNSVTVSLWNLNISFKNRLLCSGMFVVFNVDNVPRSVCSLCCMFLAFARRNNYNYNNYNYNEKVKITITTTITRKLEKLQLKL